MISTPFVFPAAALASLSIPELRIQRDAFDEWLASPARSALESQNAAVIWTRAHRAAWAARHTPAPKGGH